MNKKNIQKPAAEDLYKDELERLSVWDNNQKPPGWLLSPIAVEKFVVGDSKLNITCKFVAPREQVTRVITGLVTNRGTMLTGKPGTAKSLLSEILAAAISGQSLLTIYGGTITAIEQLLYSWNPLILKKQGPCMEALVPSPIFNGMQRGQIVRFEEISRCPQFIQDALLSILSERQVPIPGLPSEQATLFAREGFNIIATANSLDKGIHQMSAAMKRRLNFELIEPIPVIEAELDVVLKEAKKLLVMSGVTTTPPVEIVEMLVTIFHELRSGQTVDGRSTNRLVSTVMSTAEAVSVVHAMGVHAYYYRDGQVSVEDIIHFLIGAALKDNIDDQRRLKQYFQTVIANKSGAH